jgi:hypothetical protein
MFHTTIYKISEILKNALQLHSHIILAPEATQDIFLAEEIM